MAVSRFDAVTGIITVVAGFTASTALPNIVTATQPGGYHHRASPQDPASRAMRARGATPPAADKLSEAVLFSDIRNYYHIPAIHEHWTGRGQHIAIINYDKVTDQTRANLSDFFKTQLHSQTQVNFIGQGSEDDDVPSELELDIEMAATLAPDSIIDVYSFSDDVKDDVAIQSILSHPEVKVFSSSWSPCEREVEDRNLAKEGAESAEKNGGRSVKDSVDQILKEAAERGVTILYASGDAGLSCTNNKQGDLEGRSTRSWPTANPYVTAVGATTFRLPREGDTDAFHEVAWRYSGGGPSRLYEMPEYQRGWLPSDFFRAPSREADDTSAEPGNSRGWRGIPDIAMIGGEPGIKIWSKGEKADAEEKIDWHAVEGTSAAAPEMGGLIALVNEAREHDGVGPIGWLNPKLYGMSGVDRARAIRTISEVDGGSRENPKSSWNSMTGLGAPIGDEFFHYLRGYR